MELPGPLLRTDAGGGGARRDETTEAGATPAGQGDQVDPAADERVAGPVVPAPRTHGSASAGWPHVAALISSDDEMLAAAVPFLQEGLAAGDVTVLSCPAEVARVVRSELGMRAEAVTNHARISLLDARGPDAITNVRRLLDTARSHGSGRVRVVTQVHFGAEPRDWREGARFEAATNILLSGQPLASLCLYDTRMLSEEVVDSARATHPELVVGGVRRASSDFHDQVAFLRGLPVPREPVEDAAPVCTITAASSLPRLRHRLGAVLAAHVPDPDLCGDLHLAVSEVAANAFRHGRPPVSARVWVGPDQLICEITDRGAGFADPVAGFEPAHGPDLGRGGMGLWLARKLFDHVDLLPGTDGLTVRLSTRLR